MNFRFTLFLFIFCLFLINANHLNAQDEGEVVISEERLQELAFKLYELKKSRASTNEQKASEEELKNYLLKKEFNERNLSSKEILEKTTQIKKSRITEEQKISAENMYRAERFEIIQYLDSLNLKQAAQSDELMRELASLRKEIETLRNQTPEITILDERNDDVIVQVNQRNVRSLESALLRGSKTDTLRHNQVMARLDSLQLAMQRKDSINAPELTSKKLEDELVRVKNQVYLLQAKIDELIAVNKDSLTTENLLSEYARDTITETISIKEQIENERDRIYMQLNEEYGDFKEMVYFANNSTQVQESYFELVNDLVELLNKEEQIDVMISGFASKTGAKEYNQMISMQRAHELKKQLMNKGISPNRILTDYKGIDYDATTLAEARRVEVELVIRR